MAKYKQENKTVNISSKSHVQTDVFDALLIYLWFQKGPTPQNVGPFERMKCRKPDSVLVETTSSVIDLTRFTP